MTPKLIMFHARNEFLEYITQLSILPSEPSDRCAGICVMFYPSKIVLAIDLTHEDFSNKFMAPYSFFHEYVHIQNRIGSQDAFKIVLNDEMKACLIGFELTEKFLGLKFPSHIHKQIKKRLLFEFCKRQ